MNSVGFRFLFRFAWVVAAVVQQNFDHFSFVDEILQVDVLQHLLHDVGFYLLEIAVVVFDPDVDLLKQSEKTQVKGFLAQPFRNVAFTRDIEAIGSNCANGAQHFD